MVAVVWYHTVVTERECNQKQLTVMMIRILRCGGWCDVT